MKAAACAKHLAVHSGPEALRHRFNAEATPKDMEETYLRAFEACIRDAKVEAVMVPITAPTQSPAAAARLCWWTQSGVNGALKVISSPTAGPSGISMKAIW